MFSFSGFQRVQSIREDSCRDTTRLALHIIDLESLVKVNLLYKLVLTIRVENKFAIW